jgi:hypothetical protein
MTLALSDADFRILFALPVGQLVMMPSGKLVTVTVPD